MLSFPSSFSKGGYSLYQVGKHDGKLAQVPTPNESTFTNIQSKNLKLSEILKQSIYENDRQFTNFDGYIESPYLYKQDVKNKKEMPYYEDPLKVDLRVLRTANMYQFSYTKPIVQVMDVYGQVDKQIQKQIQGGENGAQGTSTTRTITETIQDGSIRIAATTTGASPSLFNPSMGVNLIGITENIPLIDSHRFTKQSPIYEPTIENLIKGSVGINGVLGHARYRLIDFLYCKDLGKVSNNHLITLRKFGSPVGDHIYKWSTARGRGNITMETDHDIGRLITWFDTDDNKLEDICKYEMQMSWKEIKNEIQEIESKEDSESRGPLGMIINSVSSKYNYWQSGTFGSPGLNLLTTLNSKFNLFKEKSNDNTEILRMSSDTHKVWEPQNTVRDTHLYDGQLTLNQDINLTFSYKLRAYDNINPKSAFLDLIGNILEVTYQRGTYWKGKARFIGPPQNKQAWETANHIIDKAWDKMGSFMTSLFNGDMSFSNSLGNISQGLTQYWDKTKAMFENIKNGEYNDNISDVVSAVSAGMKGLLKNSLGRPAIYAMNSLIDGQNCGFWHLTIGNPFNPIMCIGNLMMMSSTVTHTGPLGVDDFPSEIKVTVSLKPGRSRDATEISRYYTKGLGSIYLPKNRRYASDYHNFSLNKKDAKQSDEKWWANYDSQRNKADNFFTSDDLANNLNSSIDSDWNNIEHQQLSYIDNLKDSGWGDWQTSNKEEGLQQIAGTHIPERYQRVLDEIA